MKRLFFLLFFILHVGQVGIFAQGIQPHRPVKLQSPGTALLSYERSGAHWLTYCLYKLVEHHSINYNSQCADFNRFIPKLPSNPKATRGFFRAHDVKGLYKYHRKVLSKETDRLLLLLRDYKECYPRHDPNDPLLLLTEQKRHYFDNLEVYHNWPPERRYLVYYEDLISDLPTTLENVLVFLGEPVDGMSQFLAHLEEHKQFIMSAYDKVYSSHSKGEDLHYHAKKIDPELLEQLDELVVARYPHLVPYLERYLP